MSEEPSLRITWAVCGLTLAAGAVLRLLPCFGDLWLDEIWSIERVRQVDSALEIFTTLHHSNDHHLTSLWLLAAGDDPGEAIARLPSWLAGVASIALLGVLGLRRSRLDAIFATLLAASCFALLHYASEARGYATAVACALLAHRALLADVEDHRSWGAPVFGLAIVTGFLAHQTLLFYWAGAMLWSGLRVWRAGASTAERMRPWLRLHAAPLAAWALLYAVDLRFMQVGSGDLHGTAWLASRLIGFSIGVPVDPALALPGTLLVGAALGIALLRMARRGDDTWTLFAVTIGVAPALAILALRPEVVAVRYFLIGIAFALLLLASLLADAFRSGRTGRLASLGVLALFVAGNGIHIARFLEHGRGGYRAALAHMAQHSAGDVISVGSDHDFRTGIVLRHYGRRLHPARRLVLDRRDAPSPALPDGPSWRVLHAAANPRSRPDTIRDARGRRYDFAAAFPHAGISGFHWTVYRRSPSPGSATRRSNTIPNP